MRLKLLSTNRVPYCMMNENDAATKGKNIFNLQFFFSVKIITLDKKKCKLRGLFTSSFKYKLINVR